MSLQGNKTRSHDSATPPPRPHRTHPAPVLARSRPRHRHPRPPQACIPGCDTKAAANGRVEEAMDPSLALNQPPLAVSPADVVNRRAGTRSLAVRHRGQSNVWDVWTSPEARTAPMN